MSPFRRTLASFLLVAITSMSAQARSPDLLAAPKIVLVRGWMDVFSTGLDDLAGRLRQNGYRDVSVISLTAVAGVEQELMLSRERGRPIVLIGHSLGANAAVGLAQRLGERGIPIGLLVSFDGDRAACRPCECGESAEYLSTERTRPFPDRHRQWFPRRDDFRGHAALPRRLAHQYREGREPAFARD